MIKFGYLRETQEQANKAGIDIDTNIARTGLDVYLKVIFPEIDDWVHDCKFEGIKELSRKRPDYRSEKLKLIIEFDGLPHYTNPIQILKDIERVELYESFGYKVVRIPYFIQLSNEVVKQLFNRDIKEPLFDDNIPSLTIHSGATPAFLPLCGIKRMAYEFKKFPKQYLTNLTYLKNLPHEFDFINGVDLLENEYNNIKEK